MACLFPLLCTSLASPGARAIMDEVFRTTLSRSLRYEGDVTVVGPGGARSEKRWTVERKGEPGRGRAVIRFLWPPEVKGVALLVVSQPGRVADQWLYTPAIERVRRVAQHSRGSRFYSTDLSFEDLEESDSTTQEFSLSGEEDEAGDPCWRILSTPKQASAYDSRLLWISKAKHVILRQDLSVGRLVVKRVRARDYSLRQGVWTPSVIEVEDLRGGGRTVVSLKKVVYDEPFPDSRFTPEALSTRGR